MGAGESIEAVSPELLDQTLSSIEIPTCPDAVMRVMREAQKDIPDINELARMIAADVGMAALAIKLANSPMFGNGGVKTVPQAVNRLGTRNVVCVVVAVALRSAMTGVAPAVLERFWNRAATMAIGAGLIAKRLYRISPDEAYAYALFHDAAIPVLMRRFQNYAQVAEAARERGDGLAMAEMAAFSCNHAIVGALLARNWGLPPLIAQAIRFHHEPDLYALPADTLAPEGLSLIAVTQLAEYLSAELQGETDIEVGGHFERACAYLGLGETELADIREDLQEAISEAGR